MRRGFTERTVRLTDGRKAEPGGGGRITPIVHHRLAVMHRRDKQVAVPVRQHAENVHERRAAVTAGPDAVLLFRPVSTCQMNTGRDTGDEISEERNSQGVTPTNAPWTSAIPAVRGRQMASLLHTVLTATRPQDLRRPFIVPISAVWHARQREDEPQRRSEGHGPPGHGDAPVYGGVPAAGVPLGRRPGPRTSDPQAVPATTQERIRPVVTGEEDRRRRARPARPTCRHSVLRGAPGRR
jgi:hypothetical protein